MKSDGTNRTEFAPAAILGSPVGLALDWITQNLYYTNPSTQSIEVIKKFHKLSSVFFFILFLFLLILSENPSHDVGSFASSGFEIERRSSIQENSNHK